MKIHNENNTATLTIKEAKNLNRAIEKTMFFLYDIEKISKQEYSHYRHHFSYDHRSNYTKIKSVEKLNCSLIYFYALNIKDLVTTCKTNHGFYIEDIDNIINKQLTDFRKTLIDKQVVESLKIYYGKIPNTEGLDEKARKNIIDERLEWLIRELLGTGHQKFVEKERKKFERLIGKNKVYMAKFNKYKKSYIKKITEKYSQTTIILNELEKNNTKLCFVEYN